ncbi:hypothetical protein [Halomonas sp. H2]|uniref:hypothetical protein n=1 Tax=Halomonas sp. H2 TaxID=261936 RepID=UPI003CEBF42A
MSRGQSPESVRLSLTRLAYRSSGSTSRLRASTAFIAPCPLGLADGAYPHVADQATLAHTLCDDRLLGGEAQEDFHAQCPGLLGQPAA